MNDHSGTSKNRDDKPPHERFVDLGKKLMSVPKAALDRAEKHWQAQRRKAKAKR